MAEIKKNKRQNYISKNSIQVVGLFVIVITTLVKWLFMSKQISTGHNVYLIVLVCLVSISAIISFTLREIVSKAVSYRKSRGQYKNALRIMKTAAFISFFIGILFCVMSLLFAGRMTNTLFSLGAYGTFPFIFLSASMPFIFLWSVLLGSFDGFDFYTPDGIAQIIFGISNMLFSIIFILVGCNMGKKHAALLHDDRVLNTFGATGAAAGFMVASIFVVLWLLVLFKAFRRKMRSSISEDTSRNRESIAEQIVGLSTACGTPFARYLALWGPLFLNEILFFKFFKWPVQFSSVGFPDTYYAQYILTFFWFFLPCGLTGILAKHAEEYLYKTMRKDDLYHSGMYIVLIFKQFLCTILPLITVIGVCLKSLQTSIFGVECTGGWLYATICLLFGIAFLFSCMLKGLGKEWLGIIAGLTALVIQSISAVFLFSKECYTAERILYSNVIYVLVFLCVCTFFIYRYCVYKKQLMRHLFMPLIAAFAASISAVLCMLLKNAVGHIIAVLITLIVAFVVHMTALIVMGSIKETELSDLPQGNLMYKLGKIIGIYS